MKTRFKIFNYPGIGILGEMGMLAINFYGLTFTPIAIMLWQQAVYAKFFHKVLRIQPDDIPGLLEKDINTMKLEELLPLWVVFKL